MLKYLLIGIVLILIAFLFVNTPFYKNITNVVTKSQNVQEESKLKLLNQELGLFDIDEENFETAPKYYQAGIIEDGKYKGYKKIIAIRQNYGYLGHEVYEFASNDDKEYIYDNSTETIEYSLEDRGLNTKKVTSKDSIGGTSELITLDKETSLFKEIIAVDSKQTEDKDSNGNLLSDYFLVTDLKGYEELKSPDSKYKIYHKKISRDDIFQYTNDPVINSFNEVAYLLEGETRVLVADKWGLGTFYTIALNETINKYKDQTKEYFDYQKRRSSAVKQSVDFNETPPVFPIRPNLRFSSSDISNSTLELYKNYDVVFPRPCTYDGVTYVTSNLKGNQLVKVGKLKNTDIYTFKETNNPLANHSFILKTTLSGVSEDEYLQELKKKLPTYEDYQAKYPILFMKDYWGRWIIIGEDDLHLQVGGCGKPVIYLYPKEPTDIVVNLERNIQFTSVIPNYKNGWKVKAYPGGKLVDLQPQYTDCTTINTNISGLEYAGQACEDNSYPYLFWSGNSYGSKYPDTEKGWIVSRTDLVKFMNDKLDVIGLTQKEKSDMLEYWIPQMLNKNTTYYKISFFQTKEMNRMIPIDINPKPDSLYRVFLDYLPLTSKPIFEIEPQNLEKIHREGFTVIEWGGLKR